MTDKRDLLILGGGLVGMTLALAAAKKGLSSHLVDRADPASLTADGFDPGTESNIKPLYQAATGFGYD